MPEGRPARIAAINDDPALLELLRDLLGVSEGYEVVTCTVGEQAHDFVKEHRPDLILLDLRMGGEEIGWAVLERLTLDPETRSIPVIVCSVAVARLAEHGSLLKRDGVEVLPKPFDLEALLQKVEACLARGRG
jgi:CheY-like chemotaxis protein